jgi:MFS family permease
VTDRLFTPRFLALWLFAFGTFFAAFQLLPAIPFRIRELGGSKTAAGSFLAAYTFASAFAAPIMGSIADRVGRKRMLILASALFIVFSVLYGMVTNIPLLLAIAVVHGALWSAILSSSSAIMSDLIPESRRTQGLAYWGLASTFAFAAAPAVGIAIHHRYGWEVLCLELAILSVVMAIWSTRLPTHAAPADAKLPRVGELWDWRVIRIAASMAVTAFGYGGITSYVAMLAMERGIEPPSLFFTVNALAIVFVRLTTSHLADRYGTRAVLYPSFAAIPISFALLAVANTRSLLIAAAILFGIGLGGAFPAMMSFLVGNTEPENRARTFGSFVWAFDTGIGLGSLAIGALGDRYGLGTAFGIAAAISCLSIPIFAVTSRKLIRGGTAVAAPPEHA